MPTDHDASTCGHGDRCSSPRHLRRTAEAVVISGGALYGGSEQARAVCTLSNFSGATINITQALLRNQNGTSVKDANTCGATLASGRACQIEGAISSADHVSCRFNTNVPANRIRGILHTVDLGGNVLNNVNLRADNPSFNVTGATVGGPLQDSFVCTFSNQGTTPTTINVVLINDGQAIPGNGGAVLTSNCFGAPLAPGTSCEVRGPLTSETEHIGGNPLTTTEMR